VVKEARMKFTLPMSPKLALPAIALLLALDLLVIGLVGLLMYRAGDGFRVHEADGMECLSASSRWGGSLYVVVRCERAGK
jgi:hypothetical protein